jgi:hypothetical protein
LQAQLTVAFVPEQLYECSEFARHEAENYVTHPYAEVDTRSEVGINGGIFDGLLMWFV